MLEYFEEAQTHVRMGMGRVDPLGLWPNPKKKGRWASRVGLVTELGQGSRPRATHWVSRADPRIN
jgi:hypothetical protein